MKPTTAAVKIHLKINLGGSSLRLMVRRHTQPMTRDNDDQSQNLTRDFKCPIHGR